MGYSLLRIPVIDFSNEILKQGTPGWDLAKVQVMEALMEYGCFEALFNKIPLEVQKDLYDTSKDVFDLPLETKMRNDSKKPLHAYVGQHFQVPLFESIGIDEVNIYENVENVTRLFWPDGYPKFSKSVYSFVEKVSELDETIRRMVLESLGLEKYFDEHMKSNNYLLRLQKYTAPETNETKRGLHDHTDKNTLSILHQNQVDGLEIKTKDGQWIRMKLSPESFIVMVGDSFFAWTNGRLPSVRHQVMISGNKARYSVGFFSGPKKGYMVKAPEEMVDEEHPLLFKPFDHVELLEFYYSEEGRKAEDALKAYCGV